MMTLQHPSLLISPHWTSRYVSGHAKTKMANIIDNMRESMCTVTLRWLHSMHTHKHSCRAKSHICRPALYLTASIFRVWKANNKHKKDNHTSPIFLLSVAVDGCKSCIAGISRSDIMFKISSSCLCHLRTVIQCMLCPTQDKESRS